MHATSSSREESDGLRTSVKVLLLVTTVSVLLMLAAVTGIAVAAAAKWVSEGKLAAAIPESSERSTVHNVALVGKDEKRVRQILDRVDWLKKKSNCFINCNYHNAVADKYVLSVADAVVVVGGKSLQRPKQQQQPWGRLVSTPEEIDDSLEEEKLDFTISYFPDSEVQLNTVTFPLKEEKENTVSEISLSFRNISVAALFDRCPTPGNREGYLAEMRRFIPVDVYGDCGDIACPADDSDCLEHILGNGYKFFLVFESLLCQYYQSDLLWRVLQHSSFVPVLFGGLDLARVLPDYSFIDALDHSPEGLAGYMKLLLRDEGAFDRYLDWRRARRVEVAEWPCELCRAISSNSLRKKRRKKRRKKMENRCTRWPDLEFHSTK